MGLNAHIKVGRDSEEAVVADLKRKGFKVWHLRNHQGHPDLKVEGPDGVEFGLEVRTKRLCEVIDPTSPDFGRVWFQKEKRRTDPWGSAYAWVDRFTHAVEYEPPLPRFGVIRLAEAA